MAESLKKDLDLSKYPHIDKGLAGIVAFSSTKSFIDGEEGKLIYAGYTIDALAENATFEEVCFLLWNDRLPNATELEELNASLQEQREVPGAVLNYLKNTSTNAAPMSVLRTAVSMLADFHEVEADTSKASRINKAISITAKMPTIVAAYDRIHNDNEVVSPLPDRNTAFNFLYMLSGEEPGEQAEQTLDICLILHAEHGMNASTCTNRTICSTKPNMYSSVSGSIGALKG